MPFLALKAKIFLPSPQEEELQNKVIKVLHLLNIPLFPEPQEWQESCRKNQPTGRLSVSLNESGWRNAKGRLGKVIIEGGQGKQVSYQGHLICPLSRPCQDQALALSLSPTITSWHRNLHFLEWTWGSMAPRGPQVVSGLR